MKKLVTMALTALFCLAGPAREFNARAQTGRPVTFEVPFDFIIRGTRLTAGSYTVARLEQGNPAVLVIRAVGRPERLVFSTQGDASEGAPSRPLLAFRRCGESRLLLTIRLPGEATGRRIPPGDRERPACGGGAGQSLVRTARE